MERASWPQGISTKGGRKAGAAMRLYILGLMACAVLSAQPTATQTATSIRGIPINRPAQNTVVPYFNQSTNRILWGTLAELGPVSGAAWSGSVDIATIAAGGKGCGTFAATGATTGTALAPMWPTLDAGLVGGTIRVSAANTIEVCVINATGSPIDPIAATFGAAAQGGVVNSPAWGSITGTLSAQTDLQSALDARQPLDSDLTAVAGLASAGLVARTGAGTASARTVTGTANEITVTNGDGVGGNPTLALAATLDLSSKTSTKPIKVGISAPATCSVGEYFFDSDAVVGQNTYACTATNTWTLQGDGTTAGGVAWGAITGTLSSQTDLQSALDGKQPLDSDLTAVAGMAANGIVVRTGTGTVAARTATGTANEINVTNGDGVSGNPTFALSSTLDLSAKTSTKPMKTGISVPATCSVGEYFFDTDATAGQNTYACTATNTWTLQGDGGGGGSLPSQTGNSGKLLTTDGTTASWETLAAGAGVSISQTAGQKTVAVDSTQVPYLALNNAFLGNNTFGGTVDLSGASAVRLKTGTAAPATCTVGDAFFDTDATAGQNIYGCTATNTWTLMGDGGGGASTSYLAFPAANCQMGAAGTGFALPATLYPTPGCATGANTMVGYLEWPDADGDYWAQLTVPLSGTISSINVSGKWRTSAITGDVVIQLQTACYANGETVDPAWNTAQTITETAAATTLLANDFSLTGLTLTGCSTGETMLLRVLRNRTHVSDTLAATFQLLSLGLTINR